VTDLDAGLRGRGQVMRVRVKGRGAPCNLSKVRLPMRVRSGLIAVEQRIGAASIQFSKPTGVSTRGPNDNSIPRLRFFSQFSRTSNSHRCSDSHLAGFRMELCRLESRRAFPKASFCDGQHCAQICLTYPKLIRPPLCPKVRRRR
jgi:hypothetical protein